MLEGYKECLLGHPVDFVVVVFIFIIFYNENH